MNPAVIGLSGTVVAALLAFFLGRVNLRSANEHARQEALRQERVHTFAAFCAAVVEYRRSQLHRWFVGRDYDDRQSVEEARPQVAADVRDSRAAAWSGFYRLLMVCDNDDLADKARHTLVLTRSMRGASTPEELDRLSDEVHAAVEGFARAARATTMAQPGTGT